MAMRNLVDLLSKYLKCFTIIVNPNQSNWWLAVNWYCPLGWVFSGQSLLLWYVLHLIWLSNSSFGDDGRRATLHPQRLATSQPRHQLLLGQPQSRKCREQRWRLSWSPDPEAGDSAKQMPLQWIDLWERGRGENYHLEVVKCGKLHGQIGRQSWFSGYDRRLVF